MKAVHNRPSLQYLLDEAAILKTPFQQQLLYRDNRMLLIQSPHSQDSLPTQLSPMVEVMQVVVVVVAEGATGQARMAVRLLMHQ
jgi:hypothetical protein